MKWLLLGENKLFNNRKEVKDYIGGQHQFNRHFYQMKDIIYLTDEVCNQIKNN